MRHKVGGWKRQQLPEHLHVALKELVWGRLCVCVAGGGC